MRAIDQANRKGRTGAGDTGWKLEGNTTQTSVNVAFPNTAAPGAKV